MDINNIYLVARKKDDRERSVDILSLQSEFEHAYLNKIMPGISVLTTRFRYMSFICWTIRHNIEPRSEEFRLLEDALAKNEYKINKSGRQVGAYKGSRNIVDGEPHYYVQSVFGDYRNTMEGLDLLTSNNNLTENGKYLADRFERSVGGLPRNLSAAANNGFSRARKSLLSLSSDEKKKYRELFDYGGRKDDAKCRKRYSALYKKLLSQTRIEDEEGSDNTQIDLVKRKKTDIRLGRLYPLAFAMFNYIYIVYCFTEALHRLHDHLINNRQIKRINLVDASSLQRVKSSLDDGLRLNRNFAWHASVDCMKGLMKSDNRQELLQKLIKRMQKKGDRAWLVFDAGHIKLNPLNPPVPKSVRPFGIRLAPYSSLMNDLKGQ